MDLLLPESKRFSAVLGAAVENRAKRPKTQIATGIVVASVFLGRD